MPRRQPSTRRLLRLTPAAAALAGGVALLCAVPAAACGGLVAPNGAVRLARATTFVAWHDGTERYLTSFAYQGDVPGLGWIVPLPAVPERVERGGSWTLQRLQRETHPVALVEAQRLAAAAPAQVLEQVRIDALDVTVLRGSGQAVVDWCHGSGFSLPDETRAHLLTYARTSPIFMAARYDLQAARQRGQFAGDGTPVLITMRTPRLWIPLEVLANALDPVVADLYLLTDERPAAPQTLAPGLVLTSQERMSPLLQRDLSSDRNMSWVPRQGWLTDLSLDAPSPEVTYDMAVTPDGGVHLAGLGADARMQGTATVPSPRSAPWRWVLPAGGGLTLAVGTAAGLALLRRRRRSGGVAHS
jgi:Uncharacterized protein conserved in bacteria (DUF2330)